MVKASVAKGDLDHFISWVAREVLALNHWWEELPRVPYAKLKRNKGGPGTINLLNSYPARRDPPIQKFDIAGQ